MRPIADTLRTPIKIAWIALRILIACWMGKRGTYFFYQGF